MEVAQKTFISSTFWTERIGPTAAIKTLEIMKKIKSWEIITATRRRKVVNSSWEKVADDNNLNISTFGIPAVSSYRFNENNLVNKTFITQEMLKKGFLASTNFYGFNRSQ